MLRASYISIIHPLIHKRIKLALITNNSFSKHLRVPVVANGGIKTLKDAQDCLEYTGANAVMVGRIFFY